MTLLSIVNKNYYEDNCVLIEFKESTVMDEEGGT